MTTTRRIALLALLSGLVFGALALLSTPAVAAKSTCNWGTEYHRTVAEMREDPTRWTITPGLITDESAYAETNSNGEVTIDPATPCKYVASVVRHEHMHMLQFGRYGLAAGDHYPGEEIERVADCGSLLLGSTRVFYVGIGDSTLASDGDTCTEDELGKAQDLIDHAGDYTWPMYFTWLRFV